MPSLEIIERLKKEIDNFGDEAVILSKTGETIREVKSADQELDPIISDLLDDIMESTEATKAIMSDVAKTVKESKQTTQDSPLSPHEEDGLDSTSTKNDLKEQVESEKEIDENFPDTFLDEIDSPEETQFDFLNELETLGNHEDFSSSLNLDNHDNLSALTDLDDQDDLSALADLDGQDDFSALANLDDQDDFSALADLDDQDDFSALADLGTQENTPENDPLIDSDLSFDDDFSFETEDSLDLDSPADFSSSALSETEEIDSDIFSSSATNSTPLDEINDFNDLDLDSLTQEGGDETQFSPNEAENDDSFLFSELLEESQKNNTDSALQGQLDAFSSNDAEDFFALEELDETQDDPIENLYLDGDSDLNLDSTFESPPLDAASLTEQFSFDDLELSPESDTLSSKKSSKLSPLVATGAIEEEYVFSISDSELLEIKKILSEYPHNLKILVEEFLGKEKTPEEKVEILNSMILEELHPKVIAEYLEKETGKTIKLPAQYKNLSGSNLERQQNTFFYKFITQYAPVILIILTSLGVFTFFLWTIFGLLIPWGASSSKYKEGKKYIISQEFEMAEECFDMAYYGAKNGRWPHFGFPNKNQVFEYAEDYQTQHQFLYAEEKYKTLLRDYYKKQKVMKKTQLDYGKMLSEKLLRFNDAITQLEEIKAGGIVPQRGIPFDGLGNDIDASFALARVYFLWGNETGEIEKYHNALRELKTYSVATGKKNRYEFDLYHAWFLAKMGEKRKLSSLLEYYLTNKHAYKTFKKAKKDILIYNDLLDFYLNQSFTAAPVTQLLEELETEIPNDPELGWHRSRQQRLALRNDLEEKSLQKVLNLLQVKPFHSKREHRIDILSHNRLGELDYANNKIVDAKNEFKKALSIYESLRDREILKTNQEYGQIYSNLGDIYYYYAGNLDAAYLQYANSEANFYKSHNLDYKQGFIDYWRGDYAKAKQEFYYVLEEAPHNTNAIFAMANTMLQDANLSHAQSHYTRYIQSLNELLPGFQGTLNFQQGEQVALVQNLETAYNNLAITHYRQYERTSDVSKRDRAMLTFTKSVEYYNMLGRRNKIRSGASIDGIRNYSIPGINSIASLNQREIWHKDNNPSLQIMQEIPFDLETIEMAEVLDRGIFTLTPDPEILEPLDSKIN